MNRKNILWLVLDFVFLVVFNVVFFILAGTKHPASVWISYAFIHVAYLLVLVTPFLNRKGSNSVLFGLTLQLITGLYFGVAFLVGLVFILLHPISYKGALITQIILAGLYLIMLIPNVIANDISTQHTNEQMESLQYVRTCTTRLKSILTKTRNRHLKKKIENVYDIISASPAKSNSIAQHYELLIIDMLELLEKHLEHGDIDNATEIIDDIIKKANERNSHLTIRP